MVDVEDFQSTSTVRKLSGLVQVHHTFTPSHAHGTFSVCSFILHYLWRVQPPTPLQEVSPCHLSELTSSQKLVSWQHGTGKSKGYSSPKYVRSTYVPFLSYSCLASMMSHQIFLADDNPVTSALYRMKVHQEII